MNRITTTVTLIATASILCACQTARQIDDANEQLTSYYYAKQQAADDPVMKETAITSLRELGRTSAEQAASTSDPRNKISFYRVAATAAWQAGDPAVIEYSAAGSEVCEEQWSSAPRDCGMLTFIDDLAAVDETTDQFGAARRSGPNEARAVELFERYEESAITMIENRANLVNSVPGALVTEYDNRLDVLICKNIAFAAIGYLAESDATIDGACRLGNLRFSANEAGATLSTCTGAVPTEKQQCN